MKHFISRSSCSQVFFQEAVLENFSKLIRKNLWWSLFLTKLQVWCKKRPQQIFFRKITPILWKKITCKHLFQKYLLDQSGLDKLRICVRDVLKIINFANRSTWLFFNKNVQEHIFAVTWVHEATLKLGSHLQKKLCYLIESPLKMMKNVFYFILKALFILKIFRFLSQLFGHVGKTAWLER